MAESSQRILVIEDEPLVRDLVALNLSHAGYDVSTAATYNEGFSALTSGRFDLAVVVDATGVVDAPRRHALTVENTSDVMVSSTTASSEMRSPSAS